LIRVSGINPDINWLAEVLLKIFYLHHHRPIPLMFMLSTFSSENMPDNCGFHYYEGKG
jgi:hypothetical protein